MRRRAVVAGATIALVAGVATAHRSALWASRVALWTDAARKAPWSARVHLALGHALTADSGHRER